jgi:hypothetical protein
MRRRGSSGARGCGEDGTAPFSGGRNSAGIQTTVIPVNLDAGSPEYGRVIKRYPERPASTKRPPWWERQAILSQRPIDRDLMSA